MAAIAFVALFLFHRWELNSTRLYFTCAVDGKTIDDASLVVRWNGVPIQSGSRVSRGEGVLSVDDLKYRKYSERLSILYGKPTVVVVGLSTKSGTVSIDSDPLGAVVYEGGRKLGVTPLRMELVAPGHKEYRLSAQGLGELVVNGEVKDGSVLELSARFPFGDVIIESDPPGAAVYERGSHIGVTPITLRKTKTGKKSYVARMESMGLSDQIIEGVLKDNGVLRLKARFPYGDIKVISIPPGAEVFEGAELLGKTPLTIPCVSAGEKCLTTRLRGFVDHHSRVTVADGGSQCCLAALAPLDENEAAQAYKTGAERLGDPHCKGILSNYYLTGKYGISKNKDEALRWAKASSDDGSPFGYYSMAVIASEKRQRTMDGVSVDELFSKAFKGLEDYAEKGSREARLYLGIMCEEGKGAGKDPQKAAKWLDMAVSQGSREAMCHLSSLFDNGVGVPKDKAKAFSLCEQAARKGMPLAQRILGSKYHDGDYVDKDVYAAARWWEKAASQGDGQSAKYLFSAYYKGEDLPQDYALAKRYLKQALTLDDPALYYSYGLMCYQGLGEGTDYGKAAKYFELAAMGGHGEAQCRLAFMYSEGKGVRKNAAESLKWLKRAASKGVKDAEFGMGVKCESGESGSLIDAVEWYGKAARKGHLGAKKALERLSKPRI